MGSNQEIRQKAVQKYLEGESPAAIYKSLGSSKAWFYKWLKRYRTKKKGLVRRGVEGPTELSGSHEGGDRKGRPDAAASALQPGSLLWHAGHPG